MPNTAAFYSVNEGDKPETKRVHHTNSTCPDAVEIKAAKADKPGSGGYRLCAECRDRNRDGKYEMV